MKKFIAAAFAALTLSGAATTGASAQARPRPTVYLPDVRIIQCFVTPKSLSKKAGGTQIVYTNVGPHTYHSVTFVVGYRTADSNYLRKVTDVGEFAPHARIDHHFDLYNDVTYAGKATRSCGAISAK